MNNIQELAFCACLRYLAKCHNGLTKPNPQEYRASTAIVHKYMDRAMSPIYVQARSKVDTELLTMALNEFRSDRELANLLETEKMEVHGLLEKFKLKKD